MTEPCDIFSTTSRLCKSTDRVTITTMTSEFNSHQARNDDSLRPSHNEIRLSRFTYSPNFFNRSLQPPCCSVSASPAYKSFKDARPFYMSGGNLSAHFTSFSATCSLRYPLGVKRGPIRYVSMRAVHELQRPRWLVAW